MKILIIFITYQISIRHTSFAFTYFLSSSFFCFLHIWIPYFSLFSLFFLHFLQRTNQSLHNEQAWRVSTKGKNVRSRENNICYFVLIMCMCVYYRILYGICTNFYVFLFRIRKLFDELHTISTFNHSLFCRQSIVSTSQPE